MPFKKNVIDKFAIPKQIKLLTILIPVYNEMPNLAANLSAIINYKFSFPSEIIIVESNSQDGSRDVVKEFAKNDRVRVFYEEDPLGKGHAIIEGMKQAKGDVISIFDSDGEYLISDLDHLLLPIELGETSFVLGSRHSTDRRFFRVFKNQKFLSSIMNIGHIIFTLYFFLLFGKKFKDPFTMHKIFRSEIFKDIELTSMRFEIDWEILGISIRRGSIPKEFPAQYTSRSFKEGKKVSFLLDPIRWIVFGLYFKFRKLK